MNKMDAEEARWKELVAKQPDSGLSIKKYCSRQGIAVSRFYYWRKKLERRSSFIALQPSRAFKIKINGTAFELDYPPTAEWIGEVARVLGKRRDSAA